MTKLILLHTVVVLHFTHHLKRACLVTGGGGRCQNAQKHLIIIFFRNLFCKKPVDKYQFAMAYIRALVMRAFKEINCLISQSKHYVVGIQKNRRNETVLLLIQAPKIIR